MNVNSYKGSTQSKESSNMSGIFSGISTDLSIPAAPGANASVSDILNFEEKLMLFQMEFDAIKTAISTVGDAAASAADQKPQVS
jgi:hypothetical protein